MGIYADRHKKMREAYNAVKGGTQMGIFNNNNTLLWIVIIVLVIILFTDNDTQGCGCGCRG